MPFRDIIGYILHDVQANGKGALILKDPTPVDPRLRALDNSSTSTFISTTLTPTPRMPKFLYNKSKKRGRPQDSDEPEEGHPALKKVDLRAVIAGLSDKIGRARRARETYLTN
jgi:hypothetical protein